MNKENNINTIIEELISKGSNIDYLQELKDKSISLITKDRGLDEILSSIASEIKYETEKFLGGKNEFDTNFGGGVNSMFNAITNPTQNESKVEKPQTKSEKNSDALSSFFNM